jgi:hypothetical protein
LNRKSSVLARQGRLLPQLWQERRYTGFGPLDKDAVKGVMALMDLKVAYAAYVALLETKRKKKTIVGI